MALSFEVVREARSEYLTAMELAGRVYCDSVDRIEPEILDAVRHYTGLLGNEPFLMWRRVKALAKESQLLPRGLLDGRPGDLDAQQTRRALLFVESKWPGADGILLIRDHDRQHRRVVFQMATAQRFKKAAHAILHAILRGRT